MRLRNERDYLNEGYTYEDSHHLNFMTRKMIEDLNDTYRLCMEADQYGDKEYCKDEYVDLFLLKQAANSFDQMSECSESSSINEDYVDTYPLDSSAETVNFLHNSYNLHEHYNKHVVPGKNIKYVQYTMVKPDYGTRSRFGNNSFDAFVSVDNDGEVKVPVNINGSYDVGFSYPKNLMPEYNTTDSDNISYFGYALEIYDTPATDKINFGLIRKQEFVDKITNFLIDENAVLEVDSGIFSNGHKAKLVHTKFSEAANCFDMLFFNSRDQLYSLFGVTPLGLQRYLDRAGIFIFVGERNGYKIKNYSITKQIAIGAMRAGVSSSYGDIEQEFQDQLDRRNNADSNNFSDKRVNLEREFWKDWKNKDFNFKDDDGDKLYYVEDNIKDFTNKYQLIYKFNPHDGKQYYFHVINKDDLVGSISDPESYHVDDIQKLKNMSDYYLVKETNKLTNNNYSFYIPTGYIIYYRDSSGEYVDSLSLFFTYDNLVKDFDKFIKNNLNK